MLKKTFVRNGRRKIIGSITTGFSDESAVARDGDGRLLGRVSNRFNNARDAHGNLVSIDTQH